MKKRVFRLNHFAMTDLNKEGERQNEISEIVHNH